MEKQSAAPHPAIHHHEDADVSSSLPNPASSAES